MIIGKSVHYGIYPAYRRSRYDMRQDDIVVQWAEFQKYRQFRRTKRVVGEYVWRKYRDEGYEKAGMQVRVPALQLTVERFRWVDIRGIFAIHADVFPFRLQLANRLPLYRRTSFSNACQKFLKVLVWNAIPSDERRYVTFWLSGISQFEDEQVFRVRFAGVDFLLPSRVFYRDCLPSILLIYRNR